MDSGGCRETAGRSRPRFLSRAQLIPIGIRVSLWLALLFGVIGGIHLLGSAVMEAAGEMPRGTFLKYLPTYGAVTVISWWIVLAVKREHLYTRALLVAALAMGILYSLVTEVIAKRSIAAVYDLVLPGVAVWYFPDKPRYRGILSSSSRSPHERAGMSHRRGR